MHAVLHTQPGDSIFLRGGTYKELEIWIRDARGMGGSPGRFKTIQNYNGEHAILQNTNGIYLSASWIRIQGIQFQGVTLSSNTWDGSAPNNIQIIGNAFYGATNGAAIDVVGNNLLVNKNWIALNNQPSDADSGIALHYGTNNVISGNYISGSTGFGLYAYDENMSVYPAGAASTGYNNVLIAGNVIKGSVMRSGVYLATGSNFAVQNVTIRNNVIVANHQNGLDIETGNGINVFNNTIYGNGADSIHLVYPGQISNVHIENNIMDAACSSCGATSHVSVTNPGMPGLVLMDNLYWPQSVRFTNVTDSKPLFADPAFTNAASGDFTLTSSSPAIDAGVNVGLPFNGIAPDLGAFEYSGTSTPVNRPPIVSAGSNQTITLPASANLSGTASDDGLPTGSTLTETWSKVSGPGTVTFGNVHALTTTATFSAAGTYLLQLAASDGALTSTSTVTVTVNAAPILSAQLAWDPDTAPSVAGYNVYRSNQSGVFTSPPLNGSTLLTVTSFTDSTVQSGQTYYYVVRAVSTGGVESSSSNQIQFPAATSVNHAPTVNAGSNQTITLPASANLSGTASDDGLPTGSTLTETWSTVSGPGTVTFGNVHALSTTASFSAAGTYVLQLSASDGALTSSATVTITVNAPALAPVMMAWDPNTESYLAGYNVYRSSQSGVFTSPPLNGSTLLTVTSFTDSTVQSGQTYYYAVRAVSTSGMESTNSNILQVIR